MSKTSLVAIRTPPRGSQSEYGADAFVQAPPEHCSPSFQPCATEADYELGSHLLSTNANRRIRGRCYFTQLCRRACRHVQILKADASSHHIKYIDTLPVLRPAAETSLTLPLAVGVSIVRGCANPRLRKGVERAIYLR